jgi:SdrD B-like domain
VTTPATRSLAHTPTRAASVVAAPSSTPRASSSLTAATPAACLGSIAGKVYNDANRNLRSDAGETGLANAKIELENSSGAILQTVVTDTGDYNFVGLVPGDYSVRETPPAAFVASGESIAYLAVTCGSIAVHDFVNTSIQLAEALTPAPQVTPTRLVGTSPELAWVVTGQPVTALYVDSAGDIYYGSPSSIDGVGNPFLGDFALWKKPANSAPIELTGYNHNLIGGIAVYKGNIYFDEAGALDRIPDDNQMHEQVDTVLRFPVLSSIYGHINSSLEISTRNNGPILLISVGSQIDSNFDDVGHPSGIQPPYYEDFPTGRILFADLPWLETTHNYAVIPNGTGQVYEYARGVRNPWGMTVGAINGQTHVFAVDNDPAFRPEKYDNNLQNAGDELNDIVFGIDYGHPYYYAGEEPPPYRKPIAVFLDGSVPSGVAIAGGRLFVSLYQAKMIVEVDPTNSDYKRSWKPVLTDIDPFTIAANGNRLYIASWQGIRVIDVNTLE